MWQNVADALALMRRNSNVNWLIRLRWAAIVGQSTTIFLAIHVIEIDLPLRALTSIVGIALLTNLALVALERRGFTPEIPTIGSVLLFDTALLATLLYYSGGSANPFSTLFLVHITLAAVVLGPAWTWLLGGFSTLCYLALFKYYVTVAALNEHQTHRGTEPFSLHLHGMLVAFVLTTILVTYFLDKVAKQVRWLEGERLRQSRLASLATLSAGAAHELGSPLSTISIASGELANAVAAGDYNKDFLHDNISIIESGTARCKKIIEQMGGQLLKENRSEPANLLSVLENLTKDLHPLQHAQLEIDLETELPEICANAEMLRIALNEMLKNAFDASDETTPVTLSIRQNGNDLTFAVKDIGSGIPEGHLESVTEPFFTTKQPGGGMGLGFFIVDLFARSVDGKFVVESTPETAGTIVTLSIPIGDTAAKRAFG